ncbi:TerC/Alx family metal homeostasis membrane protein [Weeksellaceae bacterium A-14]|uniref:TerC/Alx family metal homeostasis membrane protein n=1 Tax=Daejeonia sp. YH14 TaxID=3439042 RepID=UPI0031E4C353
MSHELIFLIGFFIFIGLFLAYDLGLFTKKKEDVSLKHAGIMSFMVVAMAAVFYFVLREFGDYIHSIDSFERLEYIVHKYRHPVRIIPGDLEGSIARYNHNLALEYFTGYVVEYALSVDNIFVMMMIFTSFGVAKQNYHRVLFWGILGAIVMRFIFIFAGAALINKFDWILDVFGLFLLYTGIKMYLNRNKEEHIDTEHHPIVKFANKYFRMHNQFVGNKFWIKVNGVTKLTPLFLVLVIVEFTDVIFAVDSIPAIFSVTHDPYIVFFSNIFAIMGLRSMFFLLAGVVDKLRYLKIGLSALLVFIGFKMIFHVYLEEIGFKTTYSLLIIVGILATAIIASLLNPLPRESSK